jgi:uncharacterized protein YraI
MNALSKRLKQLALAAALVPAVAAAELAVTTQGVNMRAGPDASYPQVAYLGPGFQVDVVGCVEGWQWCDVVAGPNRGWVFAGYLSHAYGNRPNIISYAGPTLGIPLVAFSIGSYWDNHYRSRPFWRERARWYNHRIAHGNDWRHDGRGNDWRHDRNGNDWRGHDNRRGNDWRGNNNHGPVVQDRGRPGPGRPDESGRGDGFHADQQ